MMENQFASSQETLSKQSRAKKSFQKVILDLGANFFLAILKSTAGVIGYSPSLLSDGIISAKDVAYSLVATVIVRTASKPVDKEHPYGHFQLETIRVAVGWVIIPGRGDWHHCGASGVLLG